MSASSSTTTPGAHHDALYEKLVQQERIIQSAALPADEMPSCMNLFDKWATCFGTYKVVTNTPFRCAVMLIFAWPPFL